MIVNPAIKSASDLVTLREHTRTGFVRMALEKNNLAIPYVEEARALKTLSSTVEEPRELKGLDDIRPSLISASGLSVKSLSYLTDKDIDEAIDLLIEKFLEPAGSNFSDELVYRYLLVKGDALGGQARNLAGALGERRMIRTLISVLSLTETQFYWLNGETNNWQVGNNTNGIEDRVKALSWTREKGERVLALNINVPEVKKNVDLCLLNGSISKFQLKGSKTSIHKKIENYISLGELKGGIDPAGADEHWKTANSALDRIRKKFEQHDLSASTFFVGAAIENSMAIEIYRQLSDGVMENAANLLIEDQLINLCHWLIDE